MGPQDPASGTELSSTGAADELNSSNLRLPTASGGHSLAELTDESVGDIWQRALGELGGMLADQARSCQAVAISAPDWLVATFPAHYNFHKVTCERPQNLARFEAVLNGIVGHPIKVEFRVAPESGAAAKQQVAVSPRKRQQETAEHPLIRRSVELFAAQITGVKEPDEA